MKTKLLPMDMVPCKKPRGELVKNGRRHRASDGKLYQQYFGNNSEVYDTDGESWFHLELNMGRVRKYMASIGAKGGKKSKRAITPEQQKKMQAARKKK